MFNDSGVKLNLSSGMASAASTNCFSMVLIWRSATEASVGAGCAGCWAGEELDDGVWLTAPTAKQRTRRRNIVRKCFIGGKSPNILIDPKPLKDITRNALDGIG